MTAGRPQARRSAARGGPDLRDVALAAAALLVVGLALTTVVVLPAFLYPPLTRAELAVVTDPQARLAAATAHLGLQVDTRTSLAQAIGIIAAVSGAALAWRQYRSQREDRRNDEHAALFADALTRLRDDHAEARIGALFLLDHLATVPRYSRAAATVLETFVQERCQERHGLEQPFDAEAQVALTSLLARPADAFGIAPVVLDSLDLHRADLRGAHLEGASLRDAWLSYAHLDGAHLQGADLTSAHLDNAFLHGVDLVGAWLDGTDLTDAHLTLDSLRGALHREVIWQDGFTTDPVAEAHGARPIPADADARTSRQAGPGS